MLSAQTATDVTVTKMAVDHKLQMEEENVKWLQEKMAKSTELKSGLHFWSFIKVAKLTLCACRNGFHLEFFRRKTVEA